MVNENIVGNLHILGSNELACVKFPIRKLNSQFENTKQFVV